MTNFFQSEMVRGDLQEMMELQKYCFMSANAFPILSKEKKLEYFEVLKTLIEKQKIFNTRISLSDDPEAKEMADTVKQAVVMLGGDEKLSINDMFDDLIHKVDYMKQQLEAEA